MIKKYSFFRLIFSTFLYLLFSFIFVSQVSALDCSKTDDCRLRHKNCKYCAENYTTDAGCTNGGVKQCFKEGCNETGGGGSTCPWQGASSCGSCSNPGTPAPTAPVQQCQIREGGEVGICVRMCPPTNPNCNYCQPSCNNDWSTSCSEPNVEPKTLKCEPCGNNTTCCRKISPPPTQPPGTPPPTQPPGTPPPTQPPPTTPPGTPPPTSPPGTPTPTITPGGPTLTPTPTITPGGPTLTNTPIPGTPTPTYIPVALPTYRVGQTNPLNSTREPQTWRCLTSEYYVGPHQPGGKKDHRLRLTGQGFPVAPTQIYIVGCVATGSNTKCTSGCVLVNNQCVTADNPIDISPLEIQRDLGHSFIVQPDNPMTTNDYNGTINKVVYSSSKDATVHAFYAVLLNEPIIDERTGGTIQYKSFKFKEDITKCTAVRWDPYGRVFDSQSLEPIPDIKVTILDGNKNPVGLPGLINPDITTVNGAFNFLVEAGSYYLLPQPEKEYLFVKNPKLDPGYIKAYSNIYRPNDLIVEKEGQPEHRDIPLDPGENAPYSSSPSSVNFAVLPIQGVNQTKIVGQVSHPLTIVSLKQNNKEIAKTWADKMGFYEFLIDNQNITQGVKIIPHFTKINLAENRADSKKRQTVFGKIFDYVLSLFKKKTAASPIAFGVPIDPIPSYLEGYVYDRTGRIAPLAFVNVKTSMSGRNYWQTKTDEKGLLIVLPQNLPLFDYYLEIIPQNAPSFTLPISEFILKNKEYLDLNNINLMTATKNGQPLE